jgi:DNA (cytosine-5)-methyltransferase 1
MWLSPDCKHFSKAKGGKPVEKTIRGLAWIALKWAGKVHPRVIILENVEEFVGWGPIRKGKPVKSKKGQTFEQWKSQLIALGYKVEHRELRACDYGAPTIRKRFFLIARRDGMPIVWPQPTHGDPNSLAVTAGRLKPWRTAAEIIDWSIPCPSIFERKRPLAENTMRRIAKGIQRFVIDNPRPFIVNYKFTNDPESLDRPLSTITSVNGHYVVVPHVTKFRGGSTGHEVNEPLHTITSGAGSKRPAGAAHAMGVVAAFLAQYHTETAGHEVRGQDLQDPLLTLDTSNRYSLVTSHLIKLRQTASGNQ